MNLAEINEVVREAAEEFRANGALSRVSYYASLSPAELLDIYRVMYTSRRLDDVELALLKQGKAWFSISGAGTEAVCAVAGKQLRRTDPMFPFYRDRATCLARGVTPLEMLQELLACASDPASGGHQMPAHWGHRALAVIPQTSPTGSQCLAAVGLADAIRRTRSVLGEGVYPTDSVVYVSIGDAATFQGEFYECVKGACAGRSPLLIHILDNGWGISVASHESHAAEDVSAFFAGWPNLLVLHCDGTDVRESLDTWRRAVRHARSGAGPVLVRSKVLRLYSHSASDDQRKYRPPEDISREAERDPLPRYAREIVAYGVAAPDELLRLHEEVEAELQKATERALALPKTELPRIEVSVYHDNPAEGKDLYRRTVGNFHSPHAGKSLSMAEAINTALDELMSLDRRIVMWGEDIADFSERTLRQAGERLEGKGGVFGVTRGLQRKHGAHRVWNSPLAEATILGKALGFALQGYLPVVEIQFRDFLNPGWQQLVDEISTLSFRSNGAFRAPMVIRMASGGYLLGAGAIWHSEMAAGPLLHQPGLRVAVPSNGRSAAASLRGAVYCGDPVLFLEPKALYRRRGGIFDAPYPDMDTVFWPGEGAQVYGDGKDLTIVSFGNTTPLCRQAQPELEKRGIRARVLDLVWLHPLDGEAIRRNAEETGRVLIVEEDRRRCGAGAHLADAIYQDRALRRKVDVERLAARDSRVPYGPDGERYVLPQIEDVLRVAAEMCGR